MRPLLTLVFILVGSLVFAQNNPKDTSRTLDPGAEYYKKALPLIDSAKYKEAISLLQKAAKKSPDMIAIYNKMAYCKMQLKDYKGAQKDLEISHKKIPDNEECLKYLGRAYFYNQKYDEAKKCFDTSLAMKPDDHELHYFIAELKLIGKDVKGAIASCNEALFISPKYVPALYKRGIIKFQQKDYNYAIKDISDGLAASKDTTYNKEIYETRAKSYFEVGNYKAALEDYNKILTHEPKYETALVERGATKIYLNDNSGAVDDLTKAIEINKKSFMAYNFRGTAKSGLKQYVEALKDLDMSIKLKFDYHPAYVNRAAVKMASKDKKGACKDLEMADQLGSSIAYKLIQQYCGGL